MKRGHVVPFFLILVGLLLWIPRQRSMRLDDWFVFSRHNGWYFRIASSGGIIRCAWASGDPFPGGIRWSAINDGMLIGTPTGAITDSTGKFWEMSMAGEFPDSPTAQFSVSYTVVLLNFVGLGLLLAINRWRKAARKRKSLENRICVKCGYDLRASGDRCPECGTLQQLVST